MAHIHISQSTTQRSSSASSIIIKSLLWFGLPGIWMLFNVEVLNPRLVAAGVPLIWSFSLSLYTPLLFVLIATLIAYRREGHPWKWSAFAQRMRLSRMSKTDWKWTLGGLVLALLGEGLLEPTTRWLASFPLFTPPPALPALVDPFQVFTLPITSFMGTELYGNWWVVPFYGVCLFINIIGEELAWRGYLLPQQEQVLGSKAWLFNAFLWIFVLHAVLRWVYIGLLPTGLLTPFIAQRTKNTWPAIIIHGVGNTIFLLFIIGGVLGLGQ